MVGLGLLKTELGTRQHWRDNVTMFSGQQMIDYCRMSVLVAATLSRHQGLNTSRIFSRQWSSITLWRCHCRQAIQLSRAQLCLNCELCWILQCTWEWDQCCVSVDSCSPRDSGRGEHSWSTPGTRPVALNRDRHLRRNMWRTQIQRIRINPNLDEW